MILAHTSLSAFRFLWTFYVDLECRIHTWKDHCSWCTFRRRAISTFTFAFIPLVLFLDCTIVFFSADHYVDQSCIQIVYRLAVFPSAKTSGERTRVDDSKNIHGQCTYV